MTRRNWLALTAAAPAGIAQGDDAVRASAAKWLALVDQRKYKDAYKQSSQHMRAQATVEEWEPQIRTVRDGAGEMQNRSFSSAKASKTMAGAPDGEYTVLEFATAFGSKPKAVEIVVLGREGGGWKVAGYSIR